MKAMQIQAYGKNQRITEQIIPVPEIGSTDILIEVHAASVNPVDYKLRDGSLKKVRPKTFPLTLGNDFAGVVTKVGSEVTQYGIGDKVYGAANSDRWGTFAEYYATDQRYAALMPDSLSFEEAASLPLTALTAYQGIHEWLALKPGQKIFIPGGSGGVGVLAIPIAKELGAFVATTGSERGRELIESLHPDLFIDYQKQDFTQVLTNVDAVFDTRGGEDLFKSFSILKKQGKIASIAGLPTCEFAKREGLSKPIQLALGINNQKLKKYGKEKEIDYTYFMKRADGTQLAEITRLVNRGIIKPIIDRSYALSETQAALDYVESGRTKGKVVIKVK